MSRGAEAPEAPDEIIVTRRPHLKTWMSQEERDRQFQPIEKMPFDLARNLRY